MEGHSFCCTATATVLYTILYKEWLYAFLSTVVCRVTNTQAPSQIFVQYSQENRNPKVQSKGSCGSINTHDPYLSHTDPLFEEERGYNFSFKHIARLSRLEAPVISQQRTMGCVGCCKHAPLMIIESWNTHTAIYTQFFIDQWPFAERLQQRPISVKSEVGLINSH